MAGQVTNIHGNQAANNVFDFFNNGTFKKGWQDSTGAQKVARVFLAIGLGFPVISIFTAGGLLISKAAEGALTKRDVGYAFAFAIPVFGPAITAGVVGPGQIRRAVMGVSKTSLVSLAIECPEQEERAQLIPPQRSEVKTITKRHRQQQESQEAKEEEPTPTLPVSSQLNSDLLPTEDKYKKRPPALSFNQYGVENTCKLKRCPKPTEKEKCGQEPQSAPSHQNNSYSQRACQ